MAIANEEILIERLQFLVCWPPLATLASPKEPQLLAERTSLSDDQRIDRKALRDLRGFEDERDPREVIDFDFIPQPVLCRR
jgi:hypothetical protein